jgi:hypothetical protein
MTMETKQHVSFTIRVVPEGSRGRWRGEIVHQESERRAEIGSLWDLAQFVGEEIDHLAPRDDTEWTRLISWPSPADGMPEQEASKAS